MPVPFCSLPETATWYHAWLTEAALPLWSMVGVDAGRGAFQEALTPHGKPHPAPRRARVQARQVWVFATAAGSRIAGPWAAVAGRGYDFYLAHHRRPDGLFARVSDVDGVIIDDTAALYEQAFSLNAMAALHEIERARSEIVGQAQALRSALETLRHPAGGYREVGDQPFQANAHMHLLEAALAWERADPGWSAMADEIAELALGRFIDPEGRFLWEFFDEAWCPLPEAAGGLIEPGHQFEWAWLLHQWGGRRGKTDVLASARALYEAALGGVDARRSVAVGSVWRDMSVRNPVAQLWAQTEHLRAALTFGDEAQVLVAARGLSGFLETPARGVWWDHLQADGAFVDEPARATSLYHLMGAILPLLAVAR